MAEIEKGIPFPAERKNYKDYGFDSMEIGDSVLVHNKHAAQIAYNARVRFAPKVFLARKIDGKYRIWRMKDLDVS